MTEEEKKEFEEFLKWKKEKEERQNASEHAEAPQNQESNQLINAENEQMREDVEQEPQEKTSTFSTALLVIPLILFAILAIVLNRGCNERNTDVAESETAVIEEDSILIEEQVAPAPEPTKSLWFISTETDAMTDSKNIWASITSDDYIRQDFPYDGFTYAKITVRYMKKYGYDVLIGITKGQIDGRSYYGTDYVTARFDEGQPKKYFFNDAADGSSDVVFLRNSSDFIKKCKQATNIKIDIPVYKSGRPVFTFHVDEPLVWPEK